MKGAPIRFVAAVLGGWACIRIAVLLPGHEPLALAGDVLAPPAAAASRPSPRKAPASVHPQTMADGRSTVPHAPLATPRLAAREPAPRVAALSPRPPLARESSREAAPTVLIPATLGAAPSDTAPRRWSASAWLLARGGAGGTLSGGQIGASQAGARILYRLDSGRRLSLAGRVATPLRGRGAEAAIGLDWQPTAAPVHLVAEERIGLDGARGGPTAMAIAGINPTPIAAGFRLEAYAQGGAILRGGKPQAFGDGAVRVTRPIITLGRAVLDIGAGAWGAGQAGATRVDVGPTISVAVPMSGRAMRLSLDWRQRVAGRARPGSGPALSMGRDF